jgi:hypothetical protein
VLLAQKLKTGKTENVFSEKIKVSNLSINLLYLADKSPSATHDCILVAIHIRTVECSERDTISNCFRIPFYVNIIVV